MKSLRAVLCASAFLCASPAFARVILPDACGDVKAEFDVDTHKPEGLPALTDGKAMLVVIQVMDRSGGIFFGSETTRFGLDGKWIGANHGESWFAIPIEPGEHHLCGNWQGKKNAASIAFTAEAGKTYFYEATVTQEIHHAGGGTVNISSMKSGFDFQNATDDEGRFRVKAFKQSKYKPKSED